MNSPRKRRGLSSFSTYYSQRPLCLRAEFSSPSSRRWLLDNSRRVQLYLVRSRQTERHQVHRRSFVFVGKRFQ
jgi:hypothetical protein